MRCRTRRQGLDLVILPALKDALCKLDDHGRQLVPVALCHLFLPIGQVQAPGELDVLIDLLVLQRQQIADITLPEARNLLTPVGQGGTPGVDFLDQGIERRLLLAERRAAREDQAGGKGAGAGREGRRWVSEDEGAGVL